MKQTRSGIYSELMINGVKEKKLPFGMFSGVEISEEEMDKISKSLDKTVNELS